LSFKISNLIEGNRLAFKKTGYKEKECIHFLKTCYSGPLFLVKEFLCSFKISEELMDARGNNGLMFAAVNNIFLFQLLKKSFYLTNFCMFD